MPDQALVQKITPLLLARRASSAIIGAAAEPLRLPGKPPHKPRDARRANPS